MVEHLIADFTWTAKCGCRFDDTWDMGQWTSITHCSRHAAADALYRIVDEMITGLEAGGVIGLGMDEAFVGEARDVRALADGKKVEAE